MAIDRQNNTVIRAFKGLFTDSPPELIADEYLQECENLYLGPVGELIKRPGVLRVKDSDDNPTFNTKQIKLLGEFTRTSVSYMMIGQQNSPFDLFAMDTSRVTTTITDHAAAPLAGVQYGDVFYFVVSGDGVWKWTGTGAAVKVTGSPNVKSIMTFKDRLWAVSSQTTQGSRLFYTDVAPGGGLPETWNTGTNFIDIQPGDGAFLNAHLTFSDRIILFKHNSIWNLYLAPLPSQWLVRLSTPELGCGTPEAAMVYKNQIYFISEKGIWTSDGVAYGELSLPIRTLLQDRAFSAFVTGITDTIGAWKDLILCSVSTVNEFLVYRIEQGARGWTKWTTTDFQDVPSRVFERHVTPKQYWMSCYGTNGEGIYELVEEQSFDKGYDDNEDAFTVSFWTKELVMDTPTKLKEMIDVYIFALAKVSAGLYAKPTFTWYLEGNQALSTLALPLTFDDNKMKAYRLNKEGKFLFRKFSVKCTDNQKVHLIIGGYNFINMLHKNVSKADL